MADELTGDDRTISSYGAETTGLAQLVAAFGHGS